MVWLLAGLALATTSQEVHEAEWQRLPIALDAEAPERVRVQIARALGRLRSTPVLPKLQTLANDESLAVQIAAAEAMGLTPEAGAVIAEWLAQTRPAKGLSRRRGDEFGLRVTLIEALGRQGTADDIPLLTQILREEPWPYGAAAARGLGRLGRRGIEEASQAVPELVANLDRMDPRFVSDVAYALGRIGMQDASAEDADLARDAALSAAQGPGRSWLVKAVWPALSAEDQTDLFLAAVTDYDRAVQVAALDAASQGTIEPLVLAAFLLDDDPWVRSAAIGALGRTGGGEALEGLTESDNEWVAASAQRALGTASDDPRPLVRAAGLAAVDDLATLEEIALTAEEPVVRSAAAGRLEELKSPEPGAIGLRLLDSSDPIVREAAMLLLEKSTDDQALVEGLLPHLRVETDLELAAAGLRVLSMVHERDDKAIPADDRFLKNALGRVVQSRTPRVRGSAIDLANSLAIELALPQIEEDVERELILPDGRVEKVAAGAPILSDILRIRGARVETSKGDFLIALDPDTAPLAVANFATLADNGFFDGVFWHRVVPGFVVQTGCPRGDGWGGPGWTLPDEVSAVPYDEGSVGMARNTPYDTGGSQWFVTTGPTPHLVGDYTRFGEVTRGMEVVRSLEQGDTVLSVAIEKVPAGWDPAGI